MAKVPALACGARGTQHSAGPALFAARRPASYGTWPLDTPNNARNSAPTNLRRYRPGSDGGERLLSSISTGRRSESCGPHDTEDLSLYRARTRRIAPDPMELADRFAAAPIVWSTITWLEMNSSYRHQDGDLRDMTKFAAWLPHGLFGPAALALAGNAAFAAGTPATADLLFINGQVKTPSGWAQALAVREGVIVAIGDNATVRAMASSGSRVIDLSGDALLPGLHDSHVHPMFAGLEQYQCKLTPGARADAISAAVKACAATAKSGDWILGGNWVAAAFVPGQQTKALLDEAAPNNPVLLNDEAHHSVWVNSAALRVAGVTKVTASPAGGIIEHDARGEPTGMFRENATRIVEAAVPEPSEDLRRKALVLAANQMLSYGITSFTVASVRKLDIGPLADLSAEGLLKQRIRGCIVWDPVPAALRAADEALIAQRAFFSRRRFSTDCVKMFLDGVPTESHTGAMLEPYVDTGGRFYDERPPRGILQVPQDLLNAKVTEYDHLGLSVKFHAAGDAAVRAAIDAVEAAHRANGFGGPMHVVAHSTFVAAADIPRVRKVQMAWEFSPYIWYPTPMASVDVAAAVGSGRMKRWLPIREALATRALVVAGSDWSVVPSVNPWLGMETMVTRQKPGGSSETLGEAEQVSLEDAFRIFTLNGARLMRQDDRVGSIEVGKRADLVVTAGNPFLAPITSLHDTKVRLTFIDGELVYDASRPPSLTAK